MLEAIAITLNSACVQCPQSLQTSLLYTSPLSPRPPMLHDFRKLASGILMSGHHTLTASWPTSGPASLCQNCFVASSCQIYSLISPSVSMGSNSVEHRMVRIILDDAY